MTKIIFAITGAALFLPRRLWQPRAITPVSPPPPARRIPHVIVQGRDVGTDPSGLVRLDLMRDPAGGQ